MKLPEMRDVLAFSHEARDWAKLIFAMTIAWLHGYSRPQPKWAQKKAPDDPPST